MEFWLSSESCLTHPRHHPQALRRCQALEEGRDDEREVCGNAEPDAA